MVFSRDGKTRATDKWLKGLPKGAQAAIKQRLRYMQTQEDWKNQSPRLIKKRRGSEQIWEVLIRWHENQYRPLGSYGPGLRKFTLLVGAQEKGDKLEPQTADKTANRRWQLIEKDHRYAIKYFEESDL